MANLEKIFGIKYKDVVSITGAGGKTSLMYYLGSNFKNSLMTTTTKLFVPENKNVYIGEVPSIVDGPLVVAKKQVEDKLFGFDCSEILSFYSEFDHTFIEADGARMKSLKGWNSTEPIICDFSNKTIGVLDITTLGKNTEETVFRLEEFSKITSLEKNISINNLVDIVLNENGLFKNSKFRVLYINKVETKEDNHNVNLLVEKLMNDVRFNLDRIVFGSIQKEEFELLYAKRGVFVLASGLSRRMGQDKLMMSLGDMVVIEHTLKKLSKFSDDLYIVTYDDRFTDLANKYGFKVLMNPHYKSGQSESIKRALETDYHYYTFLLGDMPYLSEETISELMGLRDDLVACRVDDFVTAPASLSYLYKSELISLTGDQGAKKVLMKHSSDIKYIEVLKQEVKDIDTMSDLGGGDV